MTRTMTTRKYLTRILAGGAFAALVLGMTPPPAAAQDYSPVVIVNDEIITGYEIDQRMSLLEAAGGARVTREQVTDLLIDDILRMQAARRAGIVPTKEEIDEGFAELSRSQGRDPGVMRQYFRSRGVTDRHLDQQIAAEVAWRNLIPATYMPRIRISDAEMEEAIEGANTATPTEPQYLLSEIRFPVGAQGRQASLAEANAMLRQLKSGGITFGDLARQRSTGTSAAVGGDLGWVGMSALTPAARQVVQLMTKDRVSAPFVDGGEVVIIGVRDTRGPGGGAASSYRLAQLVVAVAPDAAPSIASLAQQQAQAARSRVTDCASVEALKGQYMSISGDLGVLTTDQMPPPVRNAVATLPVGGISEPIRSNDGFHVIVVCDRTESGAASAPAPVTSEEQARRRLTNSKLGRYSTSLMRKLRREAVIERR